MEAETNVTQQDIIQDLLNKNVCYRCCLRVLSDDNLNHYKNAKIYIQSMLQNGGEDVEVLQNGAQLEVPTKIQKINPCIACIGLLDDAILEDIQEKVIKEVQNGGYDCDHMTCALSLPVSYQLRNHSLWLYLVNKYYNYFIDKFNCPDKLKKDIVITSVKEVWKLLSANLLSQRLKKILTNDTNRYFFININLNYDFDEKEIECLLRIQHPVLMDKKKNVDSLTRKSVELVLNDVDYEVLGKCYPIPPVVPDGTVRCSSVQCHHDSIFIAGRYNKYSRCLPQTPWIVNGQKKMETSIQDLITMHISKIIENSGINFTGSGREDVDVRMLGKGRPFCLEIINPKKTKLNFDNFRNLENNINKCNDISVRDLQFVRKDQLYFIKQGEETKTKTYNCFCFIKLIKIEDIEEIKNKINKLSELKDLILNQKTPIRVLHRRPLSVRPRSVYWMKPFDFKIENNLLFFKLQLNVQAGTYVKEFVHGDIGRTVPNLCILLELDVDILALDVEEVHLEWPPSVNY